MKRISLFAVVSVIISGLAGCNGGKDPWPQRPGPKVVAYFPPIYSLAATIAGDDAQVMSLLTTQGPHDFEPTSRDVLSLVKADMFLTIGLGLDDAVARKLIKSSNNRKLKHIALGTRLPKDMLHEGTCSCGHKHSPNQQLDSEQHHVEYDPHVWLGLPEAAIMAKAIGEELASLDPSHSAGYRQRAAALAERLTAFQVEGNKILSLKSEKPKVITHHGSLHYLARCFGIEVVGSLDAGQDSSNRKINELVETCKKHQVRLIAIEPQYNSNTSAKTLLDQLKRNGIDAAYVEIDPLETADPSNLTPDFYERKLRDNINRLASILK